MIYMHFERGGGMIPENKLYYGRGTDSPRECDSE